MKKLTGKRVHREKGSYKNAKFTWKKDHEKGLTEKGMLNGNLKVKKVQRRANMEKELIYKSLEKKVD